MSLHATLKQPDAAARYQAGEALHRRGELAAALAEYDAALALDPSHGPALHLSAMALYQQGDPAAALPRIEIATTRLDHQADVWSAYGTILAALGRAADAAQAYRRGLVLAPDDGVLWFNLGLAQRDLGWLDQAIAAFETAATSLAVADAHHELGATLQLAGRTGEAADCYGRALALDPHCVGALNNLAVIAQDAGDHRRAAELCRGAIALRPSFDDAHNNLGVSLLRLGDVDGALAAYRAALDIDPLGPKALLNLSALLFDQGRGGEAVAHGRATAMAHPADPRSWLELARVLERDDDLAGAARALTQAAGLDSRLWQAPHRLGEIYQRMGEPARALARHRQACALAPDQADVWRQLAMAALKVGDGETALAGLASLLRLDPFDPQAWAGRALALRLTGQVAAADALTDREGLVAIIPLPSPPGYPSLAAFHQALRTDLAAVRLRVWSPRGQSVIGGYQTQNNLFAEPAPSIQALRRQVDQAVAEFLENPGEAVRDFIPAPPKPRRYHSWSVTVKAGGHHAPHIHPEGCLSGVYYVETPGGKGSRDLGGLEFGRPGLAVPLAGDPPMRVVQPRPGNLVLFPSYLWHGTQTFTASGERTTVAFDVLR